jgi:hypothetical protein
VTLTAMVVLNTEEAVNLIALPTLLQRAYSIIDNVAEQDQTTEHDDILDEIQRAEHALSGLSVHLS